MGLSQDGKKVNGLDGCARNVGPPSNAKECGVPSFFPLCCLAFLFAVLRFMSLPEEKRR